MQVVLGQQEVELLSQAWVEDNLTGVYEIRAEIFDGGINLDLTKLADEKPPQIGDVRNILDTSQSREIEESMNANETIGRLSDRS